MPTKEKTRDNCSTNNISCLSLAYILSLVLIYEKRGIIPLSNLIILKLLTCGLCGILTIIDWFTISKKTKQLNLSKISMIM